ncbi:3-phosphoshikimate 1-carboxyvinyltransferase [Ligilactobacillus sp.]|uniref:3-phosphoshikimate 1-carboxyvinyltransferase n=1 Tax=Ligilactobacillus sp. TaxID=2767921 RepID=UPI002FE0F2EC
MKILQKAPENGLHGNLTVPGDKSISHRALMIGAISEGRTEIEHFLCGEDCLSTMKALQDLGVRIVRNGEHVEVEGVGLTGLKQPEGSLDMGNSGTTTRLMMGLLSGQELDAEMEGDASLSKRPMKRVSEPLKKFGAEVLLSDQGTLPAAVHGKKLHEATVKMDVASAQVKSALIFAALYADGTSTIVEKLPTRNHTEIMLQAFGADVRTADDGVTITVSGKPRLKGRKVIVPGDISSAAFFIAAAALIPGSEATFENVSLNPTRTGILHVLCRMGGNVSIVPDPDEGGERRGTIRVKYAPLRAVELTEEDVPAIIDELPLVAMLAASADGTSRITGAAELRVKETDRIAVTAAELRKFGVEIEELEDGMIIKGRENWDVQTTKLDSHGDHRIGMMDTIAALKADCGMELENEAAIDISYPTFFSDLEKITGGVKND